MLGTVVEITSEGADEHMDALSRRYTGEGWTPAQAQDRVILLVIRPRSRPGLDLVFPVGER